MLSIKEAQNNIINEFNMFSEWIDKYEHLIELGKTLPNMDDKFKTSENLIKGCQSNVWLHAETKNNLVIYTAASDAIITRGIIAIILKVFSNQTANNILNSNTDFISKIGLQEQLSPTRANGLVSMVSKIKLYALGLQSKKD